MSLKRSFSGRTRRIFFKAVFFLLFAVFLPPAGEAFAAGPEEMVAAAERGTPGFVLEDGLFYYYNEAGELVTGDWILYDDEWYYAGEDGALYRDILFCVAGKTYYADKYGVILQNAPVRTGGKLYYATSSGTLRTGWVQDGDDWYYSNADADAYAEVWKRIRGKWYYFDPDGRMAADAFRMDKDKLYYLTESGAMRSSSGWFRRADKWYFAVAGGSLYYSRYVRIRETGYYFQADASMKETDDPLAAKVADQMGGSLYNAFRYANGISYYGKYIFTPSWGMTRLAEYGISNRKGNCYVSAAVFCAVAREMGYDAHMMDGYIAYAGGEKGIHSWVEIDMDGETWCFDPELSYYYNRTNLYYKFKYGTKGTHVYVDYSRMN